MLSLIALPYQADDCHFLAKLHDLAYPCLLDSAVTANHSISSSQRYNILTALPSAHCTLNSTGELYKQRYPDYTTQKNCINKQSPFQYLSQQLQSMAQVDSKGLPFAGGLIGFWGYELWEQLEPNRTAKRNTDVPHFAVGLYHWAVITDHQQQTTTLMFHPDIDPSIKQIVQKRILQSETKSHSTTPFKLLAPFKATQSKASYQHAFEKIQSYIRSGDCYEVNLTQQFTALYQGDCLQAYQALRQVSRAPYSAYLSLPELVILSFSPEQFLSVDCEGTVHTKPIKGTRPRGKSPEEDIALMQALQNSEKDQAENVMIVDLLRNDLSKVCEVGSVKTPQLFAIESYSNVHHMVSTVIGKLQQDQNSCTLLEQTFPGGSITGAPKIRAMEIIHELEPAARTIYCGSIGYISYDGAMHTNIAIRTVLAQNGQLSCWGGGAIVADSDCEEEYQESVTKVKHLITALEAFL